uniref:XRN2-binding (XTBD) domain-containing protein n=1 Tax=Strigamia maritima TaxID=126957 RepID=T1J294_STRMM
MDLDVEMYRHPWESDEHWDLRKAFIIQYHGKFDEDRLLSLSQAYFNVEILGCSYSADVMSQLNKLAEGLPPSKRPPKKEQVTFVPDNQQEHDVI